MHDWIVGHDDIAALQEKRDRGQWDLGALPSPKADLKDVASFTTTAERLSQLPVIYNLAISDRAGKLGNVLLQDGPKCVAFSAKSQTMHELLASSSGRSFERGLDADELYAECKRLDGYEGGGTYPSVCLGIMKERGVLCHAIPAAGALPAVEEHYVRISSHQLVSSHAEIKLAIWELDDPVLIAMPVDDGWYTVGDDGIIGPPNDRILGGHQFQVCGWNDRLRSYYIKNQWSTAWANGGFARLPFSHLDKYGFEGHVIAL